ncbi:MAG: response regulator [bacterium]
MSTIKRDYLETVSSESSKGRVLIVEDDVGTLRLLERTFKRSGYSVASAATIKEANEHVALSIVATPFSLALLDLHVGIDSGGEFGRRLLDIVGNINVIIMTGDADTAARLPYHPNAIIIKSSNTTTLLEIINSFMHPLQGNCDSQEVKINRWFATWAMTGINAVRKFSITVGTQDALEKITGITTSDNQWINSVIYPQAEGNSSIINIAISPLIGCPIACQFCINWRNRQDDNGNAVKFKRKLSVDEIIGQIYLATSSERIKKAFTDNADVKIVINFTVEGDVAFNLKNCCEAIKKLMKIKKPQFSFILTTIGTEESLNEFKEKYLDLPRVRHYWSVNSLVPETREWLMPGTIGHSLEKMRELYEQIVENTNSRVTISWIVIHNITDRAEDAEMIASFFNNRPFEIKLMCLVKGSLVSAPNTSMNHVEKFKEKLQKANVNIPIRIREILGTEIYSGCGNTIAEWTLK